MALTKAKLIADGVILQSNLHASHGITTADIGEGSNLYYTDARARAAVSVSGNALSYNSSTGVITANYEESPTFTGSVIINGTLDVNGTEILVGTNNTRLAENNLRFKAASDAYIDQNTVSQAIRFRTSSSSSLDTTPIIIAAGGITTFSTDVHVGGSSAARFKSDGTNTYIDAIPASSSIIFRNSGAVEKMRLNSSGNLGIGETSPLGKLHIKTTDTASTASSVGNLLVLEDSENGMSILSSTSGAGYILFGDSGDNDIGGILYDHSANAMRFRTNGVWDRMRIDSSGNVGIGGTPSTFSNFTNVTIQGGSSGSNLDFKNSSGTRVGAIVSTPSLLSVETNTSTPIVFKTNDTERMRITSGGYTEIKATGGSSRLYLEGTSGTHFLIGTSGGDFGIYNDTASSYRMLINSSGNVGIGTTSPGHKLDVTGSGKFQPGIADGDALVTIAQTNSNAYVHAGLKINAGNTNPFYIYQSGSSNTLRFNYNSLSDAGGQMVITDAGNVGLFGQTSPTDYSGSGYGTLHLGTSSTKGLIKFGDGSTWNGPEIYAASGELIILGNSAGSSERLRIKSGGNIETKGDIKVNDTTGKFYTNAYTVTTAASVDTFSHSGAGLWEYTIRINPNPGGSGSYTDFYYGKVGIGTGWNGSNITDYIWYQEDQTAPRSLYTSGGGNKTISFVMVSGGSEYTSIAHGTTITVRIKGFGGHTYSQNISIYFRRLA